mmetsp:Transcript_18492/g.48235  ORF Transcript_18492/g.48235 Transcript_18492/m.48235 type:complete len:262 (-) Transcript_18492:131-916(-)
MLEQRAHTATPRRRGSRTPSGATGQRPRPRRTRLSFLNAPRARAASPRGASTARRTGAAPPGSPACTARAACRHARAGRPAWRTRAAARRPPNRRPRAIRAARSRRRSPCPGNSRRRAAGTRRRAAPTRACRARYRPTKLMASAARPCRSPRTTRPPARGARRRRRRPGGPRRRRRLATADTTLATRPVAPAASPFHAAQRSAADPAPAHRPPESGTSRDRRTARRQCPRTCRHTLTGSARSPRLAPRRRRGGCRPCAGVV